MTRFPYAVLGSFAGIAVSLASTVALALPEHYGDGRGLTPAQVVSATYLDFEQGQSYGAMVGLLGLPDARDAAADWYRLPNGGGQYLIVDYSREGVAVGLRYSR